MKFCKGENMLENALNEVRLKERRGLCLRR